MRPLIPRKVLHSAGTIPTPAPMPSVPLEDFNKLMQLIGSSCCVCAGKMPESALTCFSIGMIEH